MLKERKGIRLLNMWLYRHFDPMKVFFEDDSVGGMTRKPPRIYRSDGGMSRSNIIGNMFRSDSYIFLPKNAPICTKLHIRASNMSRTINVYAAVG